MASETAKLKSDVEDLQEQVSHIHDSLETRGVNSRREQSIFGRVFSVPVDAEHKAKQMPIMNCSNPHMRAFHSSWFGFFSTFFSTFAPAPLAPILKDKKTLGLTREQIGLGNLMSVTSNIFMRFVMGVLCDKLGARKGLAFILLVTCPAIVGIAFTQSAGGFIVCRFFIGMGLASFVACQVWCTQQFSKSIVGVANATSGGWGNLGGGVTNLLMPFIFLMFKGATNGDEDMSWRLCFIVPLVLHLASAFLALSGIDLPDGNYGALEKQGSKQKSKTDVVMKVGLSNINAWILTISYGFCFGVELTMTNVAALYFFEFFAISQRLSGTLASVFGMVNLFARSLGGICSDWANKHWGMRGRIWALWIWQTIEGIFCLVMGLITTGMTAPDFEGPENVQGFAKLDIARVTNGIVGKVQQEIVPFIVNGTGFAQEDFLITRCGSRQIELTGALKAVIDPRFSQEDNIVIFEPPAPFGNGDDCVSNSGQMATVVLIVFLFSISVQMAEGLTYGIVPSVSRPALGVVSGMVGAGGNAGSLLTGALFFQDPSLRTDLGLVYMGITIIGTTLLLFGVYFPDMGGMLFKAGSISYDPQRIHPPANYRGADDLSATTTTSDNKPAEGDKV